MSDFPGLVEARVVHVEPCDVIWLRTDRHVTPAIAEEIKKRAKEIWPNNEIVIGADIDIAVVRPA